MIYYALLALFVLDYVRPTSYVPALLPFRLNLLAAATTILGSFSDSGPVKNQDILSEFNTKLFLVFLGMIVISLPMADVTLYVKDTFTVVLSYVLLYWAIVKQVTDIRRLKGVIKALVFVHVTVAALNPLMFLEPEVRHYVASGAFLGDGNDFALSVNIVVPLCLFMFFDATKKLHKLMYAGAMVVLIICVIATQSRGGTVALGCVGFYYWLKSSKKLPTAVLAVALLALVLVFAPPAYFARMNTISTQEGSAQGRIHAWGAAVRMAIDNPIFGVGPGHFPVKYGAEYSKEAGSPWHTAHSIYFLILGEYGLPGITLLITLIVSNIRRNRHAAAALEKATPGADTTSTRLLASTSASMLAFATGGAFLSAIYYPHMYVLAGIMVASRRLALAEGQVQQAAAPAAPPRRITYHWALDPARRAPARRLQGPVGATPVRRGFFENQSS